MKTFNIAAGAVLVACNLVGFSQSDVPCGQTLDGQLHSNGVLTIDSRSAGIEVVGTDQETIHVSCMADDKDNVGQVRLRFTGTPNRAKLTVTGPFLKGGNLHIRVEVPRKTNLKVEMPAGQVNVDEIVGDKDIELHAGQITISSAHVWDYRTVNASVDIGQVDAQVYGASSGGFFRTFKKESQNGEYRLYAHVTTGQIELVGRKVSTTGSSQ